MRHIFLLRKPIGLNFLQNFIQIYGLEYTQDNVVIGTNAEKEGWWDSNEILQICESKKLKHFSWNDNSEARIKLNRILSFGHTEHLISCQYGWKLEDDILGQIPNKYNIHLSPLPNFRGWYGFSHAILERKKSYGWAMHKLTNKIDVGDIVLRNSVTVQPHENALSLYIKTIENLISLFPKIFSSFISNSFDVFEKQDSSENLGSYYSKNSLDSFKQISKSASREEKQIIARALYFPPYASPVEYDQYGHKKLLPVIEEGCECNACELLRVHRR
jgi:methionyl-tRNA formyltransferase